MYSTTFNLDVSISEKLKKKLHKLKDSDILFMDSELLQALWIAYRSWFDQEWFIHQKINSLYIYIFSFRHVLHQKRTVSFSDTIFQGSWLERIAGNWVRRVSFHNYLIQATGFGRQWPLSSLRSNTLDK